MLLSALRMRAPWFIVIMIGCEGGSGQREPMQVETFDDCPDLTASCTPGDGCSMADWEHGCSCGCQADGRWTCSADTIGSTCSTCGSSAPGGACTPGDRCGISGPQFRDCDCTCGANGTWACLGECM